MSTSQKIVLTFGLALFSLAAMAQTSFGVRVGTNWTNIYTSENLSAATPDFESISQTSIAGVAEIGLTQNFFLQSELVLTRKGFGLDQGFDAELFGVDLPVGVTAETKFRYLEVPVLAKYKFGEDRLRAYVMAGPSMGYATGGRIDTKAKLLIEIPVGSTPINLDAVNYNRFEVSGVVGAGLTLETGIGQFFVDARYQRGFTNLYKVPFLQEEVKGKGFGLSVGFMVPIN